MQLEQAADIRPDLDPGEKLRRLAAMLPRSARERSGPIVDSRCFSLNPDEWRRRLAEPGCGSNRRNEPLMCLRASWRIPAPTAPRFIIFEDLHWCDPSTLEFLNRLVDRVETLPVLLLVTSRPGISVAWSDQPHVTTLDVKSHQQARVRENDRFAVKLMTCCRSASSRRL